jgi:hypothetical protein
MPKPELEFFDPRATMQWTAAADTEGLSEIVLARDDQSGDLTRLFRFAPGTDTTHMGVQRHDYWEEVLIVEGALHDLTLDRTFGAGSYACRPPGMAHGPWSAPDGCVMFEQRYYK